ncbi:hypothetical protein CFK39_07870 [Brachybacterium avium]|uniref:Uncharacterized protein n=1 Tax=Brachybacterium avium TaxID=2017485 RepID=A0A220UCF8_9MICO|nr:hypothetical protein [Brachybacterium avium]ASK65765.1 hypothetical protein CFK39_07870 [Brachybacterium avium]
MTSILRHYFALLAVSTLTTWAVYGSIVAGTPLLFIGFWPNAVLGACLAVATSALFAITTKLTHRPVLSSWITATVAVTISVIFLLSGDSPAFGRSWWGELAYYAVLLGIPQCSTAAIMTGTEMFLRPKTIRSD